MRSKVEVLQEHYGVDTAKEARSLLYKDLSSPPSLLSRYTTLKLPYEAPSHPGIPSMEEIGRAMNESRLTQPGGLLDVCRIGMTVVKMSWDETVIEEAETLLFLEANSQVRAPKVYAVFDGSGDGAPPYFLVMQFIEGDTLDYGKWKAFSEEERDIICSKLSDQFDLLRSIPHEGYYGRAHNQGFRPRLCLLRHGSTRPCGPYSTYEDCVSAMHSAAELQVALSTSSAEFDTHQQSLLSSFKSALTACKGQEPTFTHLDPDLKNIIVQRLPGTEDHVSDWEVTLIDWADCGWLPAWMQAVALSQRLCMLDRYSPLDEDARTHFLETVSRNFEGPFSEQKDYFKKMGKIGYGIM